MGGPAETTGRGLERLGTWVEPHVVRVVVESPRGSAVKLKYEADPGYFTVSRPLTAGLVYPFEFGFAPSTCAEDGDPLDVIVLCDAGTYPGVVLHCRPVAVVHATQRAARRPERQGSRIDNDRVVAVGVKDMRRRRVRDLSDVDERERSEIEAFLRASVALEKKDLSILGWGDAAAARLAIERAQR